LPKRINYAAQTMRADKPAFGLFVEMPTPAVVEMVGLAGFDFVVLDAEHGNVTIDSLEPLIPACDVHRLTPIVRVPEPSRQYLLGSLERGAGGILLPQVQGPDEVAEAVRQTKYRPVGRRGFATTTRARSYGTSYEGDYPADANAETLLCVQVETLEAVEQVEAICRVPGLDLVFVGPFDLSDAMGRPGEVDHPDVVKAIEHVVDVTLKAGLLAGFFACKRGPDPEIAERWIRRGVRMIGYGTDVGLLVNSLQKTLGKVAHLR